MFVVYPFSLPSLCMPFLLIFCGIENNTRMFLMSKPKVEEGRTRGRFAERTTSSANKAWDGHERPSILF